MLKLRVATGDEITNWNTLVIKQSGVKAFFFQSTIYADLKARYGWTPRYMVYGSGAKSLYVLILTRKVPGCGTLWYMPTGAFDAKDMPDVCATNKAYIREYHLDVFLIKIEPFVENTDANRQLFQKLGLIKTSPIQQNVTTIAMPLLKTPDALLDSLRTRGRRDVRRAVRQELDIRRVEPTDETLRTMYDLMKTVNGGKGSAYIRPYAYYHSFWKGFSDAGYGNFYFAYEGNKPVASAFILQYGERAIYKDGGSTPDRQTSNEYATAIQWQAMTDAQASGATEYDFFISPPQKDLNNPQHRWYEIGHFKSKFSDSVTEYIGCYDQVIRKLQYKVWGRIGQRIAGKLHRTKFHDVYY